MNVPLVIEKFEHLLETLSPAKDAELFHQLLDLVTAYPFTALSRQEQWRVEQIKAECQQRIALLESKSIH
jgi:hypothetical protein